MVSYRIGIDEVGRGCLAGPLLVVAARQKGILPLGVGDSKSLSRLLRVKLFNPLLAVCDFGEGWVLPVEIDEQGLAHGLRLGVSRALKNLGARPNDKIFLDGPVSYIPNKFKIYECIIGADATVPLVSAASIYAKVTRDRFMQALSKEHPNYGFENHVGYATAKHLLAITKLGPISSVHRFSFRRVSR